MRVLFVTPVEVGSGETITALHMAEKIDARGGDVRFLASPFARRFLQERFADRVIEFTGNGDRNRAVWDETIRAARPDVIIFADYPLLFFSNGVSPLANKNEWVESLDASDARLVTLDHTGYAQRAQGLFFGPAHLSMHYERVPPIPARMEILLPCPMNEPGAVTGRVGAPFRYWDVPLEISAAARREVRGHYLERADDFLIFHAAAYWAYESARAFRLPYYQYLPGILNYYLRDLPRPCTIVSVNKGDLLRPPDDARIRIVNIENLPKSEYEELLFASDLMLTENRMSITLGKAVCGLLPCVALRNSFTLRELMDRMSGELRDVVKEMEAQRRGGAIYPYEVFPGGMKQELEQLGLYRDNSLPRAFRTLEIFGEDETRKELHALLNDAGAKESLRQAQWDYVDQVRGLPDAEQVLYRKVPAA